MTMKLHPSIVITKRNDSTTYSLTTGEDIPDADVVQVSAALWEVTLTDRPKARRAPRQSELEWL